jgi:hypothetical protein
MKPLPLFLILLASVSTGMAGGYLGARLGTPAPTSTSSPSDPAPTPAGDAGAAEREATLRAELSSLQVRFDELSTRVAEMRSASERTAAAPTKLETEPVLDSSNAIAALNKNAIKAVIEEDRAEQAKKREDERKQRASEQLQNRADQVAEKVGLNAIQKQQLVSYYELESARMEEFRSQMRDGGGPSDRESMRQTFQDFRTWRETELTKTFGAETAAKIQENDRMGGRGFGGDMGGSSAGGNRNNNRGGGNNRNGGQGGSGQSGGG